MAPKSPEQRKVSLVQPADTFFSSSNTWLWRFLPGKTDAIVSEECTQFACLFAWADRALITTCRIDHGVCACEISACWQRVKGILHISHVGAVEF